MKHKGGQKRGRSLRAQNKHQKGRRKRKTSNESLLSLQTRGLLHGLEILPLAVWQADGRILDANDAYLQLIGSVRQELETGALRWDRLLAGNPQAEFTQARNAPCEEIYTLPDRRQRWVLTGRTSLPKSSDVALIFAIDITERVRTEELLRENVRSVFQLTHELLATTVRELSTWVLHELSQPLMAIMADAQAALRLMPRSEQDDSALEQSVVEIASSSRRASQVLWRLRSLLSTREPDRSGVDLNQLVVKLVELLHSSGHMTGITVQLTLDPNLPRVTGDPGQLRQAFLHLIVNAVEAMQSVPERKLSIATTCLDQSVVQATFSDTGPGIPSIVATRVFDALVTTKPGAAGMGLHIVRSIIASHGGNVWLDEQPKNGAAFHLKLPILKQAA